MIKKVIVDKFGRVLDGYIPEGFPGTEYIHKEDFLEYLKMVIKPEISLAKEDIYEKGKLRAYKDILNDIEAL